MRRPAPALLPLRTIYGLGRDRGQDAGAGVAYSTTFPAHLLNVVASNLGGLAGQPEHFRNWLV